MSVNFTQNKSSSSLLLQDVKRLMFQNIIKTYLHPDLTNKIGYKHLTNIAL